MSVRIIAFSLATWTVSAGISIGNFCLLYFFFFNINGDFRKFLSSVWFLTVNVFVWLIIHFVFIVE
ncbi:hypothetical protein C2G38_2081412 [Gigaspora rosea]|uniref:Uncharacterized protein n=1 Tax=Gigaspora rosea TaxID=44941 RepID=A0A397VCJ9_9GLOM|nr:hypothetical protein C2G38_2081412 [Gigaspora rosea]